MIKAIAFDFDGVIHSYKNGYSGAMSEPNEGAFESLLKLHNQGYRIVIHSCRDSMQIARWMQDQWRKHFNDENNNTWNKWEITNIKPIDAIAFVDDRAIRFSNWKDITKYFI